MKFEVKAVNCHRSPAVYAISGTYMLANVQVTMSMDQHEVIVALSLPQAKRLSGFIRKYLDPMTADGWSSSLICPEVVCCCSCVKDDLDGISVQKQFDARGGVRGRYLDGLMESEHGWMITDPVRLNQIQEELMTAVHYIDTVAPKLFLA